MKFPVFSQLAGNLLQRRGSLRECALHRRVCPNCAFHGYKPASSSARAAFSPPVWLPELFPTRMRGTAVAFCFNAPRFISCLGPLIAGTLIAYFGGFGPAATIVGMFFLLGVVAAPFLPETKGKPLPHALWLETPEPAARAASGTD